MSLSSATDNLSNDTRDKETPSIGVTDIPANALPLIGKSSNYFKSYSQSFLYHGDTNLLCFDNEKLSHYSHSWSSSQDKALQYAVETKGDSDWASLAISSGKSTAQEVFLRYHNVLSSSINNGSWGYEEEKSLLKLVHKYKGRNWSDISIELGTQRTPLECLRHYQRTLNDTLVQSEDWTELEEEKLREAIDIFGTKDWQSVVTMLPGRTASQCLNRFRKSSICNRSIVPGRWDEDEERHLFLAAIAYNIPSLKSTKRTQEEIDQVLNNIDSDNAAEHRVDKAIGFKNKWIKVEKLVPGKNDVQCREKWTSSMDPTISYKEFSKEEDELLLKLVERFGENAWSKIATFLPGRTDNRVRLRWTTLNKITQKPKKVAMIQASNRKRALPSQHLREEKSKLTDDDFKEVIMIQK